MRKAFIIILFLSLCGIVSAVDLTGKIAPVNDSLDEMVDFDQVSTTSGANYSLYYGLDGSGTNVSGNVLQEILIGTVNQFFRVNDDANGYSWDTLDDSDMDFTGWTGVNSITTLGTISTGVWNAGAVTSSGAIAGTTLNSGQGAYELYAMNQDVETTDSPTFAGGTFNGDVLFDGATAGRDALWDKSANMHRYLDNTELGFGAGDVADYDVIFFWDGDSFETWYAEDGDDDGDWNIGSADGQFGFNVYFHTTIAGNNVRFDFDQGKLIF